MSCLREHSLLPNLASYPRKVGWECPCHDDVHGERAAAQARAEHKEMLIETLLTKGQETGYTISKYSSDTPGSESPKERRHGKARIFLEKMYLATFP
jgi:hypothetical protein